MAVDYGRYRIGLAISDPSQLIATTLMTMKNQGSAVFIQQIKKLCMDHHAVAIVVGLPLHMDGHIDDKGREIQQLSEELKHACQLPVFLWDERWTTVHAHKTLIAAGKSPSKNRERIDQMAAAFILQSFLDRLAFIRKNSEK